MSTSRLQRQTSSLLSTHLGQYTIRENHRPAWLEGLELDFYIEELQVGIEVQGRQHFEYVPIFHNSYDAFLEQRARDKHKTDLCQQANVTLHYIEERRDILPLIEQLAHIELPTIEHPNFVAYQQRQYPTESLAESHPAKGNQKPKKQRRRKAYQSQGFETEASRRRGRRHTVKEFGDNLYLVETEERHQHVLYFESYENPDQHFCDCTGWQGARNHVCSHIFAVAVFLRIAW